MSSEADLVAHLIENLEALRGVTAKRMFGGHGIFKDGLMFALVADGIVFLKVDDQNAPEFEALDLEPFTFTRKKTGKTSTMSYRRCPDTALERPDELLRWARSAHAAAKRAKK
ncbi:MAG: TfoX/Sxy family protein [Akkermansiaceae bacterium]|nr:TfoX/Sxy family protein [Akkermansiaceae bacterium]NNM30015.1 TfoX/Sxy family protein [Akkermansiaceae bacterium]